MTPFERLLLASVGLIFALKTAMLALRRGPMTASGLAGFLLAWPGVVPHHFRERHPSQPIEARAFLWAWGRMIAGATTILLLAVWAPQIAEPILGLAGIAALLLTLHMGFCDVLPWLLRWAGLRVPLLFDRPWAASTLHEFWSRRWNLAFVEMNQSLFLRPLCRLLGRRGSCFALFVLSGALHELGLSFPASGGWGLPTGYFLLQGALVIVEERFRIRSRVWVWCWVLAPAPWLFHEPFRRAVILPFYFWLHGSIVQHSGAWYLSHAIYVAALGQLAVLIASVQAPFRLGWMQDIPKLTRFNQKVFWVYGFYILLCILSFVAMTWWLHDSFLHGERAARGLASFIAVFWTVRVLVDIFWFDHRDWPQGNALLVGHALVTSLFCCLATVYWVVALAT